MERHFRFTGCLLGGAVGDALGAPVEFMSLPRIHRQYGPSGIGDYTPAYGRRGAITDDTQMTLFTAEGLILHATRNGEETIGASIYYAYLRWLSTQSVVTPDRLVRRHGGCAVADGILSGFTALHSSRAPGNACLSSLASGAMGRMDEPINDSKGCGGVMRIAPVGLFFDPAMAFEVGCEAAAITHGHPTGYLSAGCQAAVISGLADGASLPEAIAPALEMTRTRPESEETVAAVEAALDAWRSGAPATPETVEKLGKGWIAEEALAIGLYCALAAGDDFEPGVRLAVNHGGDSDSTGAIAGNLLGARLGAQAIPRRYLDDLELADLIEEIGTDLHQYSRRGQ
jgi:ADP-ribosyl-[dinitrogen reductase] hydrolase